ncbi:hypothetical protein Q428_03285 [Fervidicella metallireducens AeB]|uniref:Chromosome partition protein Smc n=1 Tax=Fervidicella metallireducens AeB TaxID=1403537 RepID=A0A017RX04_9CLOT|nr:chromosome segregation protein SMC [Fervidicella metallireducens]EYE89313.1 hypothetical protein Q428_03285 [Fervidicella metallireducens AeB]
MYLKRLEVKGFKSFADKVDLEFGKGITAIVGPNGSGKSNISDAIRWVLGEQSAKTLRGGKMEDVIFSGTENRKALGCAEVSLTIDNTNKILPLEYSEITVTRRLYRSGESEYLINNTIVRLKDIVELFMDTGIGKDGYSLIGQGKIDEILSTKSEERRNIFEEAAGIVKYKTRKQEAERKLENTKQNLIRLNDIINELEEQIEPLRKQSDIAKKYLTLREELKQLEINVMMHNYGINEEKLKKHNSDIKELTEGKSELDKERQLIIDKIEELKKRLEHYDNIFKETNDQRFNAEKGLENKQGTLKLLNERCDNYNKECIRLTGLLEEEGDLVVQMHNEQENLINEKGRVELEVLEIEENLKEINREYEITQKSCIDFEKTIENSKADIIQILGYISDINNKTTSAEATVENIKNRSMQLKKEIEVKKEKLNLTTDEIEKSSGNINNNSEELFQLNDRKNEMNKKIEILEKEKNSLIREKNECFENLKIYEAKFKTLNEMEKDMEGFNRAVKSIIKNYKDDAKVFGTVSDLIKVPTGYEIAIEIALGSSIQNIVVDSENTASQMIKYLKQNNAGRATFLPLSTIKPRNISLDKHTKEIEGYLGIAADIVSYNAKFTNPISNLLGRVIISKDLASAQRIARITDYLYRIVTLEGDVINAGGSFTGGSTNMKNTGVFTRKNEIMELSVRIEEQKELLKKSEEKSLNIDKDLNSYKDILRKIESEIQSYTIKIQTEKNKIEVLQREKDTIFETIKEIEMEISHNESEIHRNIENIKSNTLLLEKYEIEHENINKKIETFQNDYKNLQIYKEEVWDKLTKQKIILADKMKTMEILADKIRDLESQINNRNKKKIFYEEQLNESIKGLEFTKNEIKNLIADIQKSAELIIELKDKIISIENTKKELSNQLILNEKQKSVIEENINSTIQSIYKLEVVKSKLETEIEALANRLWDDYELTIPQAEKYKIDISNFSEANKKVNELKNSIKLLGEVNVNSIEEFKRVTERYEFLSNQKLDLQKAETSLMSVIEDITTKMQEQFVSKFKEIKENFNLTFRELFGGGYADLKLEGEDVLSSGIDIIVQPPGKKLQSLSLLSGGEKGLSAIALVFAILRMKPTPFCVLDEIEAALDDANVNRYAAFLKDFALKTQFIIITHRKGSMSVADSLYGVTMEEKGVSKMVSLKLKGGI